MSTNIDNIKTAIETNHPDITIQREQTPGNKNRISISKKGEKASPLLPLDSYHDNYENGKPLNDTIQDILDDWKELLLKIPDIRESDINDWEKAKHHIFLTLVSAELPLPEDTLRRSFLDLKLTVHYRLASTKRMVQSFPITRLLAEKHWHIPEKEIFRTARQNTETFFPPSLFDMGDFLLCRYASAIHGDKELKAGEMIHGNGFLPPSLYILTNQQMVNGAVTICHKGLLVGLYRRFGKPFYVIPTSVHETLLYPEPENDSTKEIFSPNKIKQLLHRVNRSQVPEKERLSDSLYYYDGNKLILHEAGGDDNE